MECDLGEHSALSLDDELRAVLQTAAAHTGDVIQWDYLARLLERAPKPLTDSERCDLVVALANGQKVSGSQWGRLLGVRIGGAPKDQAVALSAPMRKMLSRHLGLIVEASDTERDRYAAEVRQAIRGSVLRTIDWSQSGDPHVIAAGVTQAIGYAAWLLVSSGRAEKLRRCRFSECRQFFFVRPAEGGVGAPSRTYCRPEHVEPGEREKARERMRDRRNPRRRK